MTKQKSITALLLAGAMAIPAMALSGHNAITADQIAAAMTGAGMQVSPRQVELLSDAVAASPTPALKIRSMEPWGDRRMRVRLECSQADQCVPFFAVVRLEQGGEEHAPVVAENTQPAAPPQVFSRTEQNAPAIRAGESATLLIDGGHVHIKLSVLATESGKIGQVIRLASKDRKLTYTGEVIDEHVLRASL